MVGLQELKLVLEPGLTWSDEYNDIELQIPLSNEEFMLAAKVLSQLYRMFGAYYDPRFLCIGKKIGQAIRDSLQVKEYHTNVVDFEKVITSFADRFAHPADITSYPPTCDHIKFRNLAEYVVYVQNAYKQDVLDCVPYLVQIDEDGLDKTVKRAVDILWFLIRKHQSAKNAASGGD